MGQTKGSKKAGPGAKTAPIPPSASTAARFRLARPHPCPRVCCPTFWPACQREACLHCLCQGSPHEGVRVLQPCLRFVKPQRRDVLPVHGRHRCPQVDAGARLVLCSCRAEEENR